MIRSILAFLTIIVLGIPTGLIFIPWCMLTGNVMPLFRNSVRVVRAGLFVAGIRVQVQGLDRVPTGQACIFMSNHVSNLDPPVLIPLIPGQTSVFLKRSLMKIPLLGYAMQLAKFIPVDRAGSVVNAQESVRRARLVLEQGIHITTFVEGTRSRDGRLLPFKKGPFFLAMETGSPCIPISIWGTETMMAKGSSWIIPGTAHVAFHAPVYPADYTTREDLMEAVRKSVASALPPSMQT
jgi:1-acyl-sn-glycerol-3-phosphate acyltransferase